MMNKNIMYTGRFLLAVLLIFTFQPGPIFPVCSISCEGVCRSVSHERCDLFVEAITNRDKCCSNQSGKPAPCCNVKQDNSENGRFLLTTFRVSPPDFFQLCIIAFEDQSAIDQTGFQPKEHFILNPARSAPLYLLNLSFLC